MKNHSILIVEDEVKISEVIKSYLENCGYEVFTAQDCMTARSVLNMNKPSLIVLDLMLPDLSGEAFCREVRKTSRIPIIMLTAKVEETDILMGLEMGADDYMVKPFSVKQLVARIQALLRRSHEEIIPLINRIHFNADDLVIEPLKHEVRKQGVLVNLTPNEFKILMVLVAYPNRVFTREDLIIAALGRDFDGFDRTVDTHIKNIRQKIETNSKEPQYVLTVHGVGYRFGGA